MIPLPTLLSQVLVAFTIEADNELEHRMPHRTAVGKNTGPQRGPWLTSLAMWANFLRLIPPDGVPLTAVAGHAGITNLAGLQRWGYLTLSEDRPPIIALTRAGQLTCETWPPLLILVEQRWQDRLGPAATGLRAALEPLERAAGGGLPRYLPVVRQAMFAAAPPAAEDPAREAPDLSALLARVLLAFTLDYERETKLSLTMTAGVLRVITAAGVRLRDVPGLAGVSKEAVAMVTGAGSRAWSSSGRNATARPRSAGCATRSRPCRPRIVQYSPPGCGPTPMAGARSGPT
jgi:hypothetical protein